MQDDVLSTRSAGCPYNPTSQQASENLQPILLIFFLIRLLALSLMFALSHSHHPVFFHLHSYTHSLSHSLSFFSSLSITLFLSSFLSFDNFTPFLSHLLLLSTLFYACSHFLPIVLSYALSFSPTVTFPPTHIFSLFLSQVTVSPPLTKHYERVC
ncbi:unnamed protein product [Acanthosepion pharaonis]|uniref:Uncharacterized protein n=1 Tax=Acanthosepion pharaonis TaxID=158019 RepID=A0A812BY99_ACAPH|nr:unnamed protein product [Sepia pharaonis]